MQSPLTTSLSVVIAFRTNIATAFSSALACYAVYLLVSYFLSQEESTDDATFSDLCKKLTALCAALLFAFSPRLWLQSNHDKPYPLVSFLAALIFYLLLLWRDRYRDHQECPAYVYLGAFLCGMAFGAHHTIVLLVPAFAFLIVSADFRLIMRIKDVIIAFAFALVGFSIHLHLAVRATRNPLLNWGDPKTYSQFMWHLLRKGYPVEKPDRGLALLWAQLNAFNIPHEFTYVGLALLMIGLIAFLSKQWAAIVAYLIAILSFFVVIVGFFNTPEEVIFLTEEFFTPLYLLSAVFIGLGLFSIVKKGIGVIPVQKAGLLPVKFAVGTMLLSLPVTVCALHYVENDQHENYVAFDYASNTLRSLPQGAVLYTWGDSGAFPLWYLQGIEKMREDVDLLHTPHLVFTWYLDSFPDLFRTSILRRVPLETIPPDDVLKMSISEFMAYRPVVIDFSTRYSVPVDGYRLLQRGIAYQLENPNRSVNAPSQSAWSLYINRGMNGTMFFRDLDTGKAILIYANAHMEAAETLLRSGRIREGLDELRVADGIAPELHNQIMQMSARYGIK